MKQTQHLRVSVPLTRQVWAMMVVSLTLLNGCASTQPPAPVTGGNNTATTSPASSSPPAATKPGTAAAPASRAADKASDKTAEPKATAKRPAGPAAEASPAQAAVPAPTVIAGVDGKASEASVSPQLSAAEEKDLWERMRKGFSMPELDTPLVAEKERFYLSQPAYLQRMMGRGGRYLYFIVEELERRNMPMELALLPFVESAMNPVALSSAKAAGLWQFIPSTGRAYDLNQNWWVDNRRDVVKSTYAALDYLQKIYAMHGNDWFLALASYNWGEGSVGRAVKTAKARGLSGDYLSLNMPNETRHYVPKLIALKHIIQRSEELNIALPTMPNKPYFVTIEKTRPIDLKLAAKFAGMTVEEFVALNPAHNRPVIAASKNNEIRLPADRVAGFQEAVRKHSDENKVMASWQPYTVKPGESLAQVAQHGGVPEAEIRKANGLRAEAKILPGTKLLVPHAVVADESKVESFVAPRVYEQVTIPAQYHTVKKKESLASIASRYGLTVASLKAWNGIKKTAAKGMNLLVKPAYAQTVLTAETGERQVVSSSKTVAVVAKPEDAPTAEAKPSEEARKAVATPIEKPKAQSASKASVAEAKEAAAESKRLQGRAASRKSDEKMAQSAKDRKKGQAKASAKKEAKVAEKAPAKSGARASLKTTEKSGAKNVAKSTATDKSKSAKSAAKKARDA